MMKYISTHELHNGITIEFNPPFDGARTGLNVTVENVQEWDDSHYLIEGNGKDKNGFYRFSRILRWDNQYRVIEQSNE